MPPSLYSSVFQWTVCIIMIFLIRACFTGSVYAWSTAKKWDYFVRGFVCVLTVVVGLRPVHRSFCDMIAYANHFVLTSQAALLDWRDVLHGFNGEFTFSFLEYVCAKYSNVHTFFFIFSVLYFGSQYLACRRIFGIYWFVPFMAMVCMIDYWGFAANGIRNGTAANLMILAFSFRNKLSVALLLGILACGIHKSMMLMGGAAILSLCYKNTRAYLVIWVTCIVLSLAAGQGLSDRIASSFLSDVDARLSAYSKYAADADIMQNFSSTGFRVDFLVYAAVPMVVSYWAIYKKGFSDSLYNWILNIYIVANSFWVLMMHAAFSNRFAALSWFIAGIVLTYPFFKAKFVPYQGKIVSCVLIVWYSFTFYQNILRRILW